MEKLWESVLRIYLGGEICITAGRKVVWAHRLPGRQGRLVFAYLVTERARAVSRDELVECLWPQSVPAAFDVALSAVVSKVRSACAEVGIGRSAVRTGSRFYQLVLPADSWVDTEAAVESIHLAEAALRAQDYRAAYGPAVVAGAILRRPFLPGDEAAWVDRRREALRRARLRALDCLAQVHAATGEPTLALRAAEEAVELEPYREAGYRTLMLLHGAAGNRAEAMRVYARLEALLDRELNTTPGPETHRVRETIAGERSG